MKALTEEELASCELAAAVAAPLFHLMGWKWADLYSIGEHGVPGQSEIADEFEKMWMRMKDDPKQTEACGGRIKITRDKEQITLNIELAVHFR